MMEWVLYPDQYTEVTIQPDIDNLWKVRARFLDEDGNEYGLASYPNLTKAGVINILEDEWGLDPPEGF